MKRDENCLLVPLHYQSCRQGSIKKKKTTTNELKEYEHKEMCTLWKSKTISTASRLYRLRQFGYQITANNSTIFAIILDPSKVAAFHLSASINTTLE